MNLSNCYLFAIERLRRRGGWLVTRRSVKSWVLHALWAPSISAVRQKERVEPIEGAFRIWSPRRGYLFWDGGLMYWAPSIDGCYVEEYVPPGWVNRSIERWWLVRWFPLHGILFWGRVRRGEGETAKAKALIRKHWR